MLLPLVTRPSQLTISDLVPFHIRILLVQIPAHVAIIHELLRLIRSKASLGAPRADLKKPNKFGGLPLGYLIESSPSGLAMPLLPRES
jgi:hypothetical protein